MNTLLTRPNIAVISIPSSKIQFRLKNPISTKPYPNRFRILTTNVAFSKATPSTRISSQFSEDRKLNSRRNYLREKILEKQEQAGKVDLVGTSEKRFEVIERVHVRKVDVTESVSEEERLKLVKESELLSKLESWADQYKKDVELWGVGSSPIFTVCEDMNGNVDRVLVNEEEIRARCGLEEDLKEVNLRILRGRLLGKELESGKNVIPRNSTVAKFVILCESGGMKGLSTAGEVSVKDLDDVKIKDDVISNNSLFVASDEESSFVSALRTAVFQTGVYPKLSKFGILGLSGLLVLCAVRSLVTVGRHGKMTILGKGTTDEKMNSDKDEMVKVSVEVVDDPSQAQKVRIRRPKLDKKELLKKMSKNKTSTSGNFKLQPLSASEGTETRKLEETFSDNRDIDTPNREVEEESSLLLADGEILYTGVGNTKMVDLDVKEAVASLNFQDEGASISDIKLEIEIYDSNNVPDDGQPTPIGNGGSTQKEKENKAVNDLNHKDTASPVFDTPAENSASSQTIQSPTHKSVSELSGHGGYWLENNFHVLDPIVAKIREGFRENYMVAQEKAEEARAISHLSQLEPGEDDHELEWMKDDHLRDIVFKVRDNELSGREPFHLMSKEDEASFFEGLQKKVEQENKKLSKVHEYIHSNVENLNYGADGISIYDPPEKFIPRWKGALIEKAPEFLSKSVEQKGTIVNENVKSPLSEESRATSPIKMENRASKKPKIIIEGSDGSVKPGKKNGKEFWQHTKKWSRGFLELYNAERDPEVKAAMRDMRKDLDRWITEEEIQEAAEWIEKMPERNKEFIQKKVEKIKREMELFGPQAVVSKYREYSEEKEEDYLWWLDLPYVLCIEMYTNEGEEQRVGFYSLEMAADLELDPKPYHVIAFEDSKDCKNICYIIQAHLEMLGSGLAFVVARPPKDTFRESKANGYNVTVIRRGELSLNIDQMLEEVEEQIVEIGSKMYHDQIMKDRSVDMNALMKGVIGDTKPIKSNACILLNYQSFYSHFIGDVHQPLHVGFTGDEGGNTIIVYWYRRKSNLHHVWDNLIIDSALAEFYGRDLSNMIEAIQRNITEDSFSGESSWSECAVDEVACPDPYASESINLACKFAYKNATPGTTLGDEYFLTRLPIVEQRLAQGGVRLAATMNRIFTPKAIDM